MIGNVTIESTTDAQTHIYREIQQVGFQTLGNVRSGAYALSVGTLSQFRQKNGFNEIRIKCQKPYLGFQVDVVLNYVSEIVGDNPTAQREVYSPADYRFLTDDTSQSQVTGAFEKYRNANLYSHAFYYPRKYFILITSKARWECGDFANVQPTGKTYSPIGTWQFFIR